MSKTKHWLMIALMMMTVCIQAQENPAPGETAMEEEVLQAQELLAACEASTGKLDPEDLCMNFMVGLIQTVNAMQTNPQNQGEFLFCIDPNKVAPEQVRAVMMQALQKQPQRAGEEAYLVVSEAFNQTYPCRR